MSREFDQRLWKKLEQIHQVFPDRSYPQETMWGEPQARCWLLQERCDGDGLEQRCPLASRSPQHPARATFPRVCEVVSSLRFFPVNRNKSSILAHLVPTFLPLSLRVPSAHIGCLFPDVKSGVAGMGHNC